MRLFRRPSPSNLFTLREALAWIFVPPSGNKLVQEALRTATLHASQVVAKADPNDLMYLAVDDDTERDVACTAILELLKRPKTSADIRASLLPRARYLTPDHSPHPVHQALNNIIRNSTF